MLAGLLLARWQAKRTGQRKRLRQAAYLVLEQVLEGLQIDRLAFSFGILQRSYGRLPEENVIEIRAQNDGSHFRVIVDLSG